MRKTVSRLKYGLALATLLFGAVLAIANHHEETETKDKGPLANLAWRNIGPVNMTGRVADVEGVPGDPATVYVGSASGGVWKTTNGGVTFEPIFDDQPIASIGDMALAPGNPGVIYVGSGEANVRNSVSFGNGVYRSTDGGKTWKHVGLKDSRHISRVLVHPQDPNTVWVGALGSVYGPGEERGVFLSTDGGETWQKTLYIDDRHGVADLDIDPNNPMVVYAAMWRFERKPWTHRSGSEEGGVYKSIDGGRTWKELTKGLPKLMGRIAVKVAPSNPEVVYVLAESHEGTLFRSDDQGASFRKVTDNVRIISRGFYYTDMRVDPTNENRLFAISSRLFRSIDGGKTWQRISRRTHVDYHSLWIDPHNPKRIWQGQDGGVAVSFDGGDSWDPIRNMPLAQFYQIFHDNREPFYMIGGGLQDNGTWIGPNRTREPSGIAAADWKMFSFGDAYFTVPHPDDPDILISEYQAGGILRTDLRSRQQVDISPQPRRNDGGPVGDLEYRFNWNSPIIASPHEPRTVYFAGNAVFKTEDFGDSWTRISPDLTTNDKEKQGEAGGPAWKENTTAEYHCTIISFAESPVQAGLLWVGTDDGNLQLSRDGGGEWTNITSSVKGVPAFSPVSHVEPSAAAAGTAYIAFDRHMFDDLGPHIYRTENFGKSWTRIVNGLPDQGWVWVVREDPKNPDLLYAGTELGLYASYDRGDNWQKLHLKNLPTVSVHDILIHPRENDLLLGTHGRAIWVYDDATPIQQLPQTKGKKAHLFPIRPATAHRMMPSNYGWGDKEHRAPNPPYGALISYFLVEKMAAKPPKKPEDGKGDAPAEDAPKPEKKKPRVKLEIFDSGGALVREVKNPPMEAGVNRVAWDLAHEPPRPRRDRDPGPRSDFFGPPSGPRVLPGTYTARLTVDGQPQERQFEVKLDPTLKVSVEQLKAAHALAAEAVALASNVNDMLRGYDAVKMQLGARKKSMKQLKQEQSPELAKSWKTLEKALEEEMNRLTRAEDKPFWSQGPRLSNRVFGLGSEVDDALAGPTAAQQAYFGEIKAECEEAFRRYDRFVGEALPAFNQALQTAGVAPLAIPPKPGSFPDP